MKRVTILYTLILFFTGSFAQTPKLIWAKQLNGPSFDWGQAITIDKNGNTYSTGYFSQTVDFDPGPGVYNLTSAAGEDIFITKLDPAGNLVWATSIGAFRYQAGYSIALDENGSLYITGIFFGTVDFDPGGGVFELTSAGNEDIFVLKLTTNGSFVWAKSIGGARNDNCSSIKLDKSGNIYLNGFFEVTTDFDPSTGVFNLTSFGQSDVFICKLNNNGNLLWAKQIGGITTEAAYSIDVDELGNVFSTGFYTGDVDFDPNNGTFILNASLIGEAFISKLNSSGSFVFAQKIGGNQIVRSNGIVVDKFGDVIITGFFKGITDFDGNTTSEYLLTSFGEEDAFVSKYDNLGNLKWAKQIGGQLAEKSFAICTDTAGSIYTTGNFEGNTDFDPGLNNFVLSGKGIGDIFASKLTKNGEFVLAAQFGGLLYESGYSIKTDNNKNFYISGAFHGTVDFDPGPSTLNFTALGQSEVFILKLKSCFTEPITQNIAINSCKSFTLNNKTYNSSGTYIQVLSNNEGCDSVNLILNVTINRVFGFKNVTICEGESYFAGGNIQTTSGIYYDTLQTLLNCDSVLETKLLVNNSPKPNLGTDKNLCFNSSIIITPGNYSSYLWNTGSTDTSIMVSAVGKFWVTVTNLDNCKATDTLLILKIDTLPKKFLPQQVNKCIAESIEINSTNIYKNYLWSDGSTNNGIKIKKDGYYFLMVTDFNNCKGADSVHVNEIKCIPLSIPNAFTPNNDGKNNIFKPILRQDIKEYKFLIFNRYGKKMFETQNTSVGWDGNLVGKQQPIGTYIYVISFTNERGYKTEEKGSFLLLR